MKAGNQLGEPRSYVVRIYRVVRGGVVGQVEDVSDGVVRTFRTAGELWLALLPAVARTARQTRSRNR